MMNKRTPSQIVLWIRCYAISLTIFLMGYSLGIINTLGIKFALNFQWNDEETTKGLSWIAAIVSLGIAIGALGSISLIKRFGRFPLMILINIVSSIGMLLCAIVNYPVLLIGRFLVGAAGGLGFAVSPLFITEITPIEQRGQTTSLIGIGITSGIAVSYVWGLALDIENSTSWVIWRFVVIFPVFTNILQLLLFWGFLLETPRFYILEKNNEPKAIQSLRKIYKEEYVPRELEILIAEKLLIKQDTKFTDTIKSFWRPLFLAMDMVLMQQVAGISAVTFFSNQIFLLSGLNTSEAEIYTFFLGLLNFIGGLLVLLLVKWFTPRTLYIYGFAILALVLCGMAITLMVEAYVTTRFLILAYTLIFNGSSGCVVFIIVPQIVPAIGNNLAYFFYGMGSFIIGYSFLYIKNSAIGAQGAFFIFAGGCLIGIIHCLIDLPESQGKTFNEIMAFYSKKPLYIPPPPAIQPQITKPAAITSRHIKQLSTDSEVGFINSRSARSESTTGGIIPEGGPVRALAEEPLRVLGPIAARSEFTIDPSSERN